MEITFKQIGDAIMAGPRKVKAGVKKGWEWTKANTDVLGMVVVPLIGSVVGVAGIVTDIKTTKSQVDMIESRLEQFEDPNTHVIFLLKRSMSTAEQIAVAKAVRAGEPVEETLRQYDLI